MKIKINEKIYDVYPSKKTSNKKYDVYVKNKLLLSFGDKNYEQYFDKLGHYTKQNHYDKKRRELYLERHKNDYLKDPNYAGFWAKTFLW